jgi:hypothetical protein
LLPCLVSNRVVLRESFVRGFLGLVPALGFELAVVICFVSGCLGLFVECLFGLGYTYY